MADLFPEFNKSKNEENVKRLKSGVILLARRELLDPNFEETVVLVCIYGEEGAYGLVLNRPSHMPISEVFDGFSGLSFTREIFIGGPVHQDDLQILQITESPIEGALMVGTGIYVGGEWESVNQMIEEKGVSTRLFLGYCGWGTDQLETEVRAGVWEVYEIDIKRLLLDSPEKLSSNRNDIVTYFETIKIT